MRVLFVHQNFPGQYRHVAPALARRKGVEVVALGENPGDQLPGVKHLRYKPPTTGKATTHRYLRRLENAAFRGQQVARAGIALREKGFTPDLVCCHPGWGEGLFLRDVWPDARMLFYYEFFYSPTGADIGFDPPGVPVDIDDACRVRMLNANHLLSLQVSDWGHTATQWQASRFPGWVRERLSVVHEGIDTQALRRIARPSFALADGRRLGAEDEVVTYVARGLEPYRGFPTFLRSLPAILSARPAAQIVLVGGDDPHYGNAPQEGGCWREVMLRELDGRLDLGRVHFVGKVPHAALQNLLSLSAAHVYLTYPFVLSWSMLEAMANECLVIGSATPPVEEVIAHGENGLLVDFFDPDALARTVIGALTDPSAHAPLRRAARQTVVRRYDLVGTCLPQLVALCEAVAAGRAPAAACSAAPST